LRTHIAYSASKFNERNKRRRMMDVVNIVQEWLKENGYDGLYYPGICACKVDELIPCGQINGECRAGHIQKQDSSGD